MNFFVSILLVQSQRLRRAKMGTGRRSCLIGEKFVIKLLILCKKLSQNWRLLLKKSPVSWRRLRWHLVSVSESWMIGNESLQSYRSVFYYWHVWLWSYVHTPNQTHLRGLVWILHTSTPNNQQLTWDFWFGQFEKQRKKQQIEELESIVRLKKAEADMFQFKSDEAQRGAEALQSIVAAKSEKVEEEYATRYSILSSRVMSNLKLLQGAWQ